MRDSLRRRVRARDGPERRTLRPLYPGGERPLYEGAALVFFAVSYALLVAYVTYVAPAASLQEDARALAAWQLLVYLVPLLLAWTTNLASKEPPKRR